MVEKLATPFAPEIPRIFDMIVASTLQMLQTDNQNFPDHRLKLYELLKAINTYCFNSIFLLSPNQQEQYINALVWGSKHEHPTVSTMALTILSSFLTKIKQTLQPIAKLWSNSLV